MAAALIEVIREHDALHDPPVTASIGLALVDDAALDAKHLLATADRAMYDAKAAGPGPYSVRTPPIDETATT